MKNYSNVPEIENKRLVYEYLLTLSKKRQLEGMATFKGLIDNGYTWE
jgi:hypothetical protein